MRKYLTAAECRERSKSFCDHDDFYFHQTMWQIEQDSNNGLQYSHFYGKLPHDQVVRLRKLGFTVKTCTSIGVTSYSVAYTKVSWNKKRA